MLHDRRSVSRLVGPVDTVSIEQYWQSGAMSHFLRLNLGLCSSRRHNALFDLAAVLPTYQIS